MKKLTIIVLFLLVFLNHGAYHVVSVIQRMIIREEVAEQLLKTIPDTELEKIEVTPALRWEHQDKEFYLDGEFYDVVFIETRDGKSIAHCIRDDKETEWLKSIANRLNRATNNKCKKLKPVIFSFESTGIEEFATVTPNMSSKLIYNSADALPCVDLSIASPPPKF